MDGKDSLFSDDVQFHLTFLQACYQAQIVSIRYKFTVMVCNILIFLYSIMRFMLVSKDYQRKQTTVSKKKP